MNGSPPAPPSDMPEQSPGRLLDSWKAIASYLRRDVSTVQRWEKREGMPVHRHVHDKRGSVYAIESELDVWMRGRGAALEESEQERPLAGPVGAGASSASRMARARFLIVLVALTALLSLSYFLWGLRTRKAAPQRIESIAVLPLQNLSGDPTQEYLADGMTEELIGRLARIRDLRVTSRTSVMRFKGTQLSVPEIAKSLGVGAIVEGSVIWEGNRIRVHAQLIRAATDEHIWAESYDRELQDVLSLQSEIAQAIALKVEVSVTGEEQRSLTAARSVSPEVYESYLRGRFVLENKSTSREGVEESIGYFQQAIQRDPTFAPAYVGLGTAYDLLSTVFIGASPNEIRPKIAAAAQKALELDPELADAHLLLADTYREQWKWADSETEYRSVLRFRPNDAAAHAGLGRWLLCQGRTEEAVAWVRRGRELDPVVVSGTDLGWILFQSRRYDEAERELRSVLDLRPDDAFALWFLGFTLISEGRSAQAIPILEKAVTVSKRSPATLGVLIRAYTQAGRRKDALKLLAELKSRKRHGYVPAAAFVNAYLGLGDNERALAALEQAYAEKSNILQYLKVHPYFDPLRSDPRFLDLIRRVGLP
ncbi:MAG TPA: tetratricopeptide repeat protein [Terriglobales bacterium]